MKWRPVDKNVSRPFLVLPILENHDERSVSAEPRPLRRIKPPGTAMPAGLRLISSGTWPPKIDQLHKKGGGNKKSGTAAERPLTATLERPQLLDIGLLDKIDMSIVRKEFLCITNLCRVPIERATKMVTKRKPANAAGGRSAVTSTAPAVTPKRSRKPENGNESNLEDEEESNSIIILSSSRATKVSRTNRKQKNRAADSNGGNATNKGRANTKAILTMDRNRKAPTVAPVDETGVAPRPVKPTEDAAAVPEPCTTCGRPDLPERFHSHPPARHGPDHRPSPGPAAGKRPVMKNSVQKPVAIRFKSKHTATAPQTAAVARSPPAPRTVTCYLCGREFGTASLPLHEPKCLQKWERENESLPRHLQRKPPPKPDNAQVMSTEEWNRVAWQSSQASLAACENCGRTFLPDRLLVHQRSCKPGPQKIDFANSKATDGAASSPAGHGTSPPAVACYICGRMFGTKSVAIHEPQCLKKWHQHNDQLPPSQRKQPPVKRPHLATPQPAEAPTTAAAVRPPSATGPKKPTLPCYICGREYGTSSIYIHEPQCLRKWRSENDKLPPGHRRKEPVKPDIKFTPGGDVDYIATNAVMWQSHLDQLVGCAFCPRTFNPDRVLIHERNCKGTQ